MARILLTQAIHPQAEQRLAVLGEVVTAPATDPDTLRRSAAGCSVIVVRAPLPDDIFAAAPSIVGAVRHGAGVDMIPLEAASAHGVLVANVPGVNAGTVAEHVLGQMVRLARGAAAMAACVDDGSAAGWARARALADAGVDLGGRTLGVVGFGHVGQAIARIAALGFGMQVLAHSRGGASNAHARAATLAELLRRSDFVVLACPLTAETRGLVGGAQLALMRRGTFLVNVARGPVVDEAAMLDALRSGHLAGAALDVFDVQPLPAGHPLRALRQVLITPHVAGITDDSMRRMGEGAARAVACLLRGELPPHCVNPQALPAFLEHFRSATTR